MNSFQSTALYFHVSVFGARGTARSNSVNIGMWSVLGPLCPRSVVHETRISSEWSVQKTLSGQVQLPELDDCSMGMSFGRACTMPKSAKRSSSFCAESSAEVVNKWLFHSLSHMGWCLLKSPSQNMWSSCDGCTFAAFCAREQLSSSNVLSCVPSLYTLSNVQVLWGPWNWMMTTSLDGKGICSQLLVLSLVLTRVTALGIVSRVNL